MVLSKSKLLDSFVERVNFGHLGFCNAHRNLGIQALLLRFARIEMLLPQQVLETHPRPQQRNAIKPESYRGDFFSFLSFFATLTGLPRARRCGSDSLGIVER